MRKTALLIFMSFIVTPKLWAFPSVFSYMDKSINKKVTVRCSEKVSSVLDLSGIRDIADNLNCENMSAEDYCDCIETKHMGIQSRNQIIVLETELGFFGSGEDSIPAGYLKELSEYQRLQKMYGDGVSSNCFSRSFENAQTTLEKESSLFSRNLNPKYETNKVPAYVNNEYINKALNLSNLVEYSNSPEEIKNAESDARLMVEVAKIVQENKMTTDYSKKDFGTGFSDEYTSSFLLSGFFKESKGEEYNNSPLYKTLQKVFFQTNFAFATTESSNAIDNLIDAASRINLADAKKSDGSIDHKIITSQMRSYDFSFPMGEMLRSLCHDTSSDLIRSSYSSDSKGFMSPDKKQHYKGIGKDLLREYSPIDSNTDEGKKKFRELGLLQEKVVGKMAEQFKYPLHKVLSEDDQSKMDEFIRKKKDLMGKMWCGLQKSKANEEIIEELVSSDPSLGYKLFENQLRLEKLEKEKLTTITDLVRVRQIQNDAHSSLSFFKREVERDEAEITKLKKNILELEKLIPVDEEEIKKLSKKIKMRESEWVKNKMNVTRIDKVFKDATNRRNNLEERANEKEDEIDVLKLSNAAVIGGVEPGITDVNSLIQATEQVQFIDSVDSNGDRTVTVEPIDIGSQLTVFMEADTKEISLVTKEDASIQLSEMTKSTINNIDNITSNGFKGDVPEKILNEAARTIEGMIDDSFTLLKISGADEEVLKKSLESTKKIKSALEPRVGDLKFQELGEYKKLTSTNEVLEKFVEKKNEVARELKNNNLQAGKVLSKGPITSPAKVTKDIRKPSAKTVTAPQNDPIDRLTKVLEQNINPQSDKESDFEAYKAQKSSAANKQKAKKKKVASNKKNDKVKQEIAKLSSELKTLKEEEKVLSVSRKRILKDQEKLAPLKKKEKNLAETDSNSLRPSPKEKRAGQSKRERKNLNSALDSFRSLGAAKAITGPASSVASIIDRQVEGGVIVNGEYIPNVLLYRGERRNSYDDTKKKENGLKVSGFKGSTFETVELINNKDQKSDLIPIIALDNFDSLSEGDKELFIQKQFIKYKSMKVVIKMNNGRKVLFKSKVSLSARRQVSKLNDILDQYTTKID